jgi:outer membrane protein assembly factor BamA
MVTMPGLPHRRSIIKRLCRSAVAVVAIYLLSAPSGLRAQDLPAGQMRLSKIEFQGLKSIKHEEALKASGLSTAEVVDIAAIDAAAERLMQSGLFRKLAYSVKGTSNAATVIFTIEESVRGVPVVYDNFVWFNEEDLRTAVRRKVPSFDGTAVVGGTMAATIKTALQELLNAHKIEGTVEYLLSTDIANRPEHLYSVKGAGLRVCELHYPGASAIPERELIENSSGIFNNEYSRTFVMNYVEAALLPLYREHGRLRATYRPPQVTPAASTADCEKGVALSIPIDEGIIYTWERAVWEGVSAVTAQDLDIALGMKRGEIANVKKIEKGLSKLEAVFGRKGHLTPRIRQVPDFNDTDRRVSYRFQVEEGPQYRMGELFVTGLPEAEANNLRGRWRLLSKDVYDTGYLAEFVKAAVPEFYADMQRAGTPIKNVQPEIRIAPDREKHIVDVTIEFKPAVTTTP